MRIAARATRQVLVDYALTRKTEKRDAMGGIDAEKQKRPRQVGASTNWWPGAELNHRHKDFQSLNFRIYRR